LPLLGFMAAVLTACVHVGCSLSRRSATSVPCIHPLIFPVCAPSCWISSGFLAWWAAETICANRSDNEGSVVDRLSTCMTIGWLISSHWMRCAELCQDDVHHLADTSSLLCFPEKKQRPIPFYMILYGSRCLACLSPLCKSVSGCIHRAASRRKAA
jgi:hypothetical protein